MENTNRDTGNTKVIEQRLSDHIKISDQKFSEVSTKIGYIDRAITEIKDNHLSHLSKDLNDIKIIISKNTTDTDWLKRFFFIIASASLGALIASILNLVLK